MTGNKTARGGTRQTRVPDAERVPCPAASQGDYQINHQIVNIRGGLETICKFCGRSWADIDQGIRLSGS